MTTDFSDPSYVYSRLPLSRLTEFPGNKKLFSDSLSKESIRVLADDIEAHGLGQPILYASVDDDDGIPYAVVVDGHRRIAACALLGWTHIEAHAVGKMTLDEVEARILDCFTSARQASPRERQALYQAVYARLQREQGSSHGGDHSEQDGKSASLKNDSEQDGKSASLKNDSEQDGKSASLKNDALRTKAAKKVGISSERQARNLVRIFRDAPQEIQELVNSGQMSVGAAIESLGSAVTDVCIDDSTQLVAGKRHKAKTSKAKPAAAEKKSTAIEEDEELEAFGPNGNFAANPFGGDDEPEPKAKPRTAGTVADEIFDLTAKSGVADEDVLKILMVAHLGGMDRDRLKEWLDYQVIMSDLPGYVDIIDLLDDEPSVEDDIEVGVLEGV